MTSARNAYRLGLAVALGAALFLVWGVGALGIIGAGGRPDLMYLGALAVGVVGALLARFRSSGMAWALAATAIALVVVAGIALIAGLHHEPGASAVEILGISGMYAALFGLSAWLFRRSADLRAA
jgi:hypothetical protein